MTLPQRTRYGRLIKPPAVPHFPLPPEETDDEETDPTYIAGLETTDDEDECGEYSSDEQSEGEDQSESDDDD